jgi:hypothetical protein
MMSAEYFSEGRQVIVLRWGVDSAPQFVDAKLAASVDLDSTEYFEAVAEIESRGLDVAENLDAILAIQAFATLYRN